MTIQGQGAPQSLLTCQEKLVYTYGWHPTTLPATQRKTHMKWHESELQITANVAQTIWIVDV